VNVSGGLDVIPSIFVVGLCVGTLKNVALSPLHLGMRHKVGLLTDS